MQVAETASRKQLRILGHFRCMWNYWQSIPNSSLVTSLERWPAPWILSACKFALPPFPSKSHRLPTSLHGIPGFLRRLIRDHRGPMVPLSVCKKGSTNLGTILSNIHQVTSNLPIDRNVKGILPTDHQFKEHCSHWSTNEKCFLPNDHQCKEPFIQSPPM